MNFDASVHHKSKKRLLDLLLHKKKGENFFSFFSSLCEKAESLGAVEKLSRRSTPTEKFFCVCGMSK